MDLSLNKYLFYQILGKYFLDVKKKRGNKVKPKENERKMLFFRIKNIHFIIYYINCIIIHIFLILLKILKCYTFIILNIKKLYTKFIYKYKIVFYFLFFYFFLIICCSFSSLLVTTMLAFNVIPVPPLVAGLTLIFDLSNFLIVVFRPFLSQDTTPIPDSNA